jgi:hypothetical protein
VRFIHNLKFLFIVLATVLILSQFGCYPGESLTVQQLDMVITTYDKESDFTSYKTYALSDSVIHYNGNTGEVVPPGEDDGISREFDQLILDLIEENMNNRGYVLSNDPDISVIDLALTASVVTTQNRGYSFVPWWPWGGWGPWYPPTFLPVSFQFATGTIFIDIWDAKNRNETEETLPLRWDAALNGLLQSNSSGTSQRITIAIDQAFTQSEYLQAGN